MKYEYEVDVMPFNDGIRDRPKKLQVRLNLWGRQGFRLNRIVWMKTSFNDRGDSLDAVLVLEREQA